MTKKWGNIASKNAHLQDYHTTIPPTCKNAITEFSSYVWKIHNKTGIETSMPIDAYNHIIDALRYTTEDLAVLAFRWARI